MQTLPFQKTALALLLTGSLLALPTVAVASGETTGIISGQILKLPADAKQIEVRVFRSDTGYEKRITPDAATGFRFNQLPIGRYQVRLEIDGRTFGEQQVDVGIGNKANITFDLSAPERVEVVGARGTQIDFGQSGTGIEVTEAELDRLPVARTITDIALLAPGVIQGDSAFTAAGRALPSFAGSSVAENNYYMNGLSVANFRTGMGGAEVPFEFLKQVQVKTGGYSAEFGRSTGGVINMVSKTGTNEFEAGVTAFWEPDFLISRHPESAFIDATGTKICTYCVNSKDESDELRYNLTFGGPLIRDKLFFFLLAAPRQIKSHSFGSSDSQTTSDNVQWGGTLTWQITEDHRVEMMGFSDERENETKTQSYALGPGGTLVGVYGVGTLPTLQNVPYKPTRSVALGGGDNSSLTYYGSFGSDFNLKLMAGENKRYNSTVSGETTPYLYQYYDRKGASGNLSLQASRRVGDTTLRTQSRTEDTNQQIRADADWRVSDSHTLRFGVDDMELLTHFDIDYTGGLSYSYDFTYAEDLKPVEAWFYWNRNYGDYKTTAKALYVEDYWQITEAMTLSLGLRQERFQNFDADNRSFWESPDLLAPRLGYTWDFSGSGSAKLYGNIGRYYLPLPNNVNSGLAGKSYEAYKYWEADCFNYVPMQIPVIFETCKDKPVEFSVSRDGVSKPAHRIIDQTGLDPMYQDEWTLGYEAKLPFLGEGWLGSVEYTERDMKVMIDDVSYNWALIDYAAQNNIKLTTTQIKRLKDNAEYAMMNPGDPLDIKWDFGDGKGLVPITLSPTLMGMPKGTRKYEGLTFALRKHWNGQYSFNGSYVWAKSRGNTEGAVNSDTGNSSSTRTDVFDLPQLMLGSYGFTPNDRRHQIKLNGNYAIVEDWLVGANLNWSSGRPRSCYGAFADGPANYTGRAGFICEGKIVPRGSYGRMPNVTTLSLNTAWHFQLFGLAGKLQVDVHNPFNWRTATDFYQSRETYGKRDSKTNIRPINLYDRSGHPTDFQAARWGQISFELKF